MKWNDPIVEEIRKYRRQHADKFHGDIAAICRDHQRFAREQGIKTVSLAPKRIQKKAA